MGTSPSPTVAPSPTPGPSPHPPGLGQGPQNKLTTAAPAANQADLQQAAAIWTSLAETIRDNYGTANSAASSLVSNNHGQAIDAFETYWNKFGGNSGALLSLANGCDQMASACGHYATSVSQAKHNIEVAATEVIATLAFAAATAIFTFFATEAAAAAVIAWLSETVTSILASLATAAGDAVALYIDGLGALVTSDLATSLLTAGVTGSVTSVGSTLGSDSATSVINHLTGQQPLSAADVQKDVLVGGAEGGFLAGPIGDLGEMSGEQLSRLLVNGSSAIASTDPATAMQMASLAQVLEGQTGKVSAGVVASVASQLYTTQQLSAQGVVSDQLQDQLIKAIQGQAGGGSEGG
jgi:hypothetical protein